MLDMGFIPDIEEICTKLPAQRQTLLFSATMPPPIKKLADRFMDNPKLIEVARPASTNASITQSLVKVSSRGKASALRDLLRGDVKNAIVFCNRKRDVKALADTLKRDRFRVGQIHGDMEQADRMATLDRFKSDEINILVASDVAARGLDIKGVSHVFNYDVPHHAEDYVHRIGRTGRAGATGIAISLFTDEDAENIAEVEKLIGQKIPRAGAALAPDGPTNPVSSPPSASETAAPKVERAPRRPARKATPKSPDVVETVKVAPAEPRRDAQRDRPRPDADSRGLADARESAGFGGLDNPVPSFLQVSIGR